MARLELEVGTDVLLLETGDALLLELDPVLAIPGTLALILTTYAPSASIGFIVTPPTLALVLTFYIPVVSVALAKPTYGAKSDIVDTRLGQILKDSTNVEVWRW